MESALLLRLLHAGYAADEKSCHSQSLKEVVESMQGSSANVFLHDELSGIHDPCYFIQFVEWAAEWGMQYLAEVDLGTMALRGLPPEAEGLLQQLAPDFLETQQLIDFVVNRSGRTSVMVRDDAPIAPGLSVDQLSGLQFTTSLTPFGGSVGAADSSHTGPQRFETAHGKTFELEESCSLVLLQRMLELVEPHTKASFRSFPGSSIAADESTVKPGDVSHLLIMADVGQFFR